MPANGPSPCSSQNSLAEEFKSFKQPLERSESAVSLLHKEWSEFSVVLEMKMNERAVVSICCPVSEDEDDTENAGMIKFGDKTIEFIRNEKAKRIRRFSDLQAFMANKTPLDIYCDQLNVDGSIIYCSECHSTILDATEKNVCQYIAMNDLDQPSDTIDASEYVFNSCATEHNENHNHETNGHEDKPIEQVSLLSHKKAVLSETQIWMKYNNKFNDSLILDKDNLLVTCSPCKYQLGKIDKHTSNVIKLELPALMIKTLSNTKCLIEQRFHSLERFFAFLLVRRSAYDSCLKLLIRTYDKSPYLLVWLMEPIVLFADGKMKEMAMNVDPNEQKKGQKPCKLKKKTLIDTSLINACTALKVLYKVFDGGDNKDSKSHMIDSSISYLDLPHHLCMHFEEVLLRNSARIPDQTRSLGNFMISFLTVDDE